MNHLEHETTNVEPLAFHWLDLYTAQTTTLLRNAATASYHLGSSIHQRRNHSTSDSAFITRLMNDPSITIKPADKNLGMALVDTDWYDRELQRMLQDTVTYKRFPGFRLNEKGKRVQCSFDALQKDLFTQLSLLHKRHEKDIELWNPHYAPAVLKYLTSSVTPSTCSVPCIYLLIKVHKPSGLCGRPIVPSTRWLTTPASVLVDHLLQEIFTAANLTHIVKDTKSFVNELENTILPSADGEFLTADIASLYTNIDTDTGLQLVRRFLIEQSVPLRHSDFIMDLLEFVMRTSYLQFHGTIYHQIDGTAMGTAAAPVYANIVVYMLEKSVLEDMRASIHMYRRFLDDVFVYIVSSAKAEFMHRLNSLHPKLRFEFVSHPTEASFLDLRIHKGARFSQHRILDLSVHQKSMNLYLYIPYHSFHTDAMKRSFIQTELMRYIRNSSDRDDYSGLKRTFYQRLRDRGYPSSFLLPIFNNIYYEDRKYFLHPSASLMQHPTLATQPPQSLCLLKRIQRWKRAEASLQSPATTAPPPVFVIPYSPLSRLLPTRSLLSQHWQLVQQSCGPDTLRPIIAYQGQSSLVKQLVHGKSKREERNRLAAAAAAKPQHTQLTLNRFMQQ